MIGMQVCHKNRVDLARGNAGLRQPLGGTASVPVSVTCKQLSAIAAWAKVLANTTPRCADKAT